MSYKVVHRRIAQSLTQDDDEYIIKLAPFIHLSSLVQNVAMKYNSHIVIKNHDNEKHTFIVYRW